MTGQDSSSLVAAPVFSEGEIIERRALGLQTDSLSPRRLNESTHVRARNGVTKHAVRAPCVLGEASDYSRPSSFSRGLRADLDGGPSHLFLSGTASVGPNGETLYPGDFKGQLWRTYRNLSGLLEAGRATWHDVVRCTCYLRDIERDYDAFNAVRTEFFTALALDPLPASTAIEAHLCRSDLLVEIEVHAILGFSSPRA